MAAVANLFLDQGTTFTASVNVQDSAGNAFDLTGYSAYSQMRRSYSSTTAYNFTVTIADDPTTGVVNLSLPANITSGITEGRYVYDVELVASDSTVTRVIEGIITVLPEVTKI